MDFIPSSRTPEGTPNRCPVCNAEVRRKPATPPRDAPCPNCGYLLWFASDTLLEDLEFVVPEAIVHDLATTSKRSAIETLVARLADVGRLPPDYVPSVISAILHREELGPTGIGNGFAVPHARHDAVADLIAAIGYAPQGIDFDALDGGKVRTIILIISPTTRPADHLRALERVTRLIRSRVA